ncbi:MAG: DNA repair protein RecN [Longimicrobiaceae bacterium]
MLTDLRVRDFAVIEEASLGLGPGLNVLTGETGAGKSILVDALSLLLGERASSEVVRTGAGRARVEGVFEVSGVPGIGNVLDENGFESEDGLVILRREVAAEGRNRAWVNGSPATARSVGKLGRRLVDLHGQHQHQTLLRRDEQRAILDAFAGHQELVRSVRETHAELASVKRELSELERRRSELAEKADFLRFQVDEIERSAPLPGEDEKLAGEARRLEHSEELARLAGTIHQELGGGDSALADRAGALRREVERLAAIDPAEQGSLELLDTAFYALQELAARMEGYAGSVEHDPGRLEEIRSRRDLLFRLKSKYGPELDDVFAALERAKAELEVAGGGGAEIQRLRSREAGLAGRLADLAGELSQSRGSALERLAGQVNLLLPDLGMPGGRYEAVLLPLPETGARGAEEVEFRVALNRGFEPKPVASAASGGELARVMLALKTVLARQDRVPTLIFDEVDAGIGGRVALRVGETLRRVAEGHQVFAVTHLAQIAARAHRHLLVSKDDSRGVASASVRELGGEERVEELARMLGGDAGSTVSRDHARELLAGVTG